MTTSEHSGHLIGLSIHFFSCDERLFAAKISLQWEHFAIAMLPVYIRITMLFKKQPYFSLQIKNIHNEEKFSN